MNRIPGEGRRGRARKDESGGTEAKSVLARSRPASPLPALVVASFTASVDFPVWRTERIDRATGDLTSAATVEQLRRPILATGGGARCPDDAG